MRPSAPRRRDAVAASSRRCSWRSLVAGARARRAGRARRAADSARALRVTLRWPAATALARRRGSSPAAPAARADRQAAVLRPRPRHPARAARRSRPRGARDACSTRSSTRSSSASRGSSSRPASRTPLDRPAAASRSRPTCTTTSSRIRVLERAANGGPLFFVGDLTDRGSPLEARAHRAGRRTRQAVRLRRRQPRLRHLERQLARDGAIVLTRRGRLMPDGSYGPHRQPDRGPARRRLRRPVRAPLGEGSATTATTPAGPAAGGVPDWLQAADRQGRRRHGPRTALIAQPALDELQDDPPGRGRSSSSSATRTTRGSIKHRVRDRHQRRQRRRRRGGEPGGRLADRDRRDDLPHQAGVLTARGRPRADRPGTGAATARRSGSTPSRRRTRAAATARARARRDAARRTRPWCASRCCQREPVTAVPEVSKRMPATSRKTCPAFA